MVNFIYLKRSVAIIFAVFTWAILLCGPVFAKPYKGVYEDDMGNYDTPEMKAVVLQASQVCTDMFQGNFIVTHWLYAPLRDEVYLTGRTRGWFFYKMADCSYRPSNRSAEGLTYPRGANIMGVYKEFKTK